MQTLNEQIAEWAFPKLEELGCFLVDVISKPSANKIEVYIDHNDGLKIEMCEKVSRHLEFYLDTAEGVPASYNLEVSSPGMDNPFKVEQQYLKSIGKNVEVLFQDGVKKEGLLKDYNSKEITLEVFLPVKKKGQAPKSVTEVIDLNTIKYTKKKISF